MDNPFKWLRVVVVEDEALPLRQLKTLLASIDRVELVGEARTGTGAIELIETLQPDLVLMDIELPELNGIEVVKRLRTRPQVVFTTAYDHYAVQAFELESIDYLLKPIKKDRLTRAIHRALGQRIQLGPALVASLAQLSKHRAYKSRFLINRGDETFFIPHDTVYFIRSEGGYTFIHTVDDDHIYDSSLKELITGLEPSAFQQINRNCIVSIDKIEKLKRQYPRDYVVVMRNKKRTSLKIARNYLALLKKKMNF